MVTKTRQKIMLSELVSQAQREVRVQVMRRVREWVEWGLDRHRDMVIGGSRYQRHRPWKRWGYRWRKGFETSWGNLEQLRIPRIRGDAGEVSYVEQYERRSIQLVEAMTQAVVGGLSVRKLAQWVRGVFGEGVSSSGVDRLLGQVIERVEGWRKRRLDGTRYAGLVLDGLWGHDRMGGKLVVLVAIGVDGQGRFEVLDWEGAFNEGATAYERLLNRLYERGLQEVEVVVTDNIGGAHSATRTVYPKAHLQLCLVHFARQLEEYLPWKQRGAFRHAYWAMFDAPTYSEFSQRWIQFIRTWKPCQPQMIKTLLHHQAMLSVYYRFPAAWRHRLRTTNLLEGYFQHLRRFLNRVPGWLGTRHIERLVALHLYGNTTFFPMPKISYSTNFNTNY